MEEAMSMPKNKPERLWTFRRFKMLKPRVLDDIKAELDTKAKELIEKILTPKYIKPAPKKPLFNYPIDIWTKWHRSFFYFTSTWASPGPYKIAPMFEFPFARMEYVGNGRFNLAYLRHTGKWWDIYKELSINQCLELVADGGPFTLI
jgi:hypothetical protein